MAGALLPAVLAHGQYVGKAGNTDKKPVLRATAVYQYTGALAKPHASRLLPVVVWDGEHYQPGGLYLSRPEPLAVAPGTQYVLMQSGTPTGLFNISSAARLVESGAWVGLGRFQAEAPPPPPAKLAASKKLPVLSGGTGKGKVEDETGGPVLHRKEDAGSGSKPDAKPDTSDNGPTLHRRDASDSGNTGSAPDGDRPTLHKKDADSPAPDPERPTLHRAGADTSSAPDPDRPTLHRHTDASPATVSTPDPDRPHLRYGAASDEGRVEPALLDKKPDAGAPAAPDLPTGEAVAISDTGVDEDHSFRWNWPSPQAQTDAQAAMHTLALQALAKTAAAGFGPAAKSDADLRRAAGAAFGPGTKTPRKAAGAKPVADPLSDPQFTAFELSYGSGGTYVYSAHTAAEGPDRSYVTVIAQPDFYGKPQVVWAQTTKGDTLGDTPALHLVDAVDADGDHRAELLFGEQTAPGETGAPRQFALYSIAAGKAKLLFATDPQQ